MNLEVCDVGMSVYQKKVRLKVNHSSAQPNAERFRSCSYRISKQKVQIPTLRFGRHCINVVVDVI